MTICELFVNVEASEGELSVEVFDAKGNLAARSEPLSGDLLRGWVEWAAGSIARLEGYSVSLRFTLRKARLYSYWVE